MVRRLLQLNGFAILCVILFHAAGWGYVAMFSWAHRYMPGTTPNFQQMGSLPYYVFRTIDQIVVFSIPAFLFVSGFYVGFATSRTKSTIGWGTVRARVIKMLIPYLIWSLVIFGLLALEGKVLAPREYLIGLLTGATNPAYYYVPLLIQYYLLSPIIVYLAKKYWVPLIVVTAVIQLIVQFMHYPVLLGLEGPFLELIPNLIPKWFFLSRLFWFVAGVVSYFHLQKLKDWTVRYKWVLLGVTIAMIPLGVIEWESYLRISGQPWIDHRETLIDTLYTLTIILSFIAFDKVTLPYSKKLGDLGGKSFGIYLIHSPMMEYTARAIYVVIPWLLAYQFLFQPILITVGLGIPLLLMFIVSRSPVHRVYQYLFG